jgi:hypothetical protein
MTFRIRSIKPEFFRDEKINSLPHPARYLMVGLISMSDDRGRIQLSVPAIHGHVFPLEGDVSDRDVRAWMDGVVGQGLVLAYEVATWRYLWLPNFWRHQWLNRPSESAYPPHPDDPYGHLPIREAIAQWRLDREDSQSDSVNGSVNGSRSDSQSGSRTGSVSTHGSAIGVLTPSRAGARSDPAVNNKQKPLKGGTTEVDARARSGVDQSVLPAGLPEDQHSLAETVLGLLEGVHGERGGNTPTLRGVGLALLAFPERDHVGVARELEHWTLAGTGQRKPVKDLVRLYRTFLERSPDASPAHSGGRSSGRAKSSVARRNALMDH